MSVLRNIIVFDFETDGKNPEICNPVQVAAVVIDTRKLDLIPNSQFSSYMKPPGIDKEDYLKTITGYKADDTAESTVRWHSKNMGIEQEEVLKIWREAPDQKTVWEQFSDYIRKYNWGRDKRLFTAPMLGGTNIRDFDMVIMERLNKKYGINNIVWRRDKADILDLCYYWFENLQDGPANHQMDTLRDFFGLSRIDAHDALQDVKDEAEIICRFMRLHRRIAKTVKFKGACE